MYVPNRLLSLSSPVPATEEEQDVFYRDLSNFLTGPSSAMSQLLGQIRRVAPYFRTALLTGERACGEEAAARTLHRLSPLGNKPFLRLTAPEADRRLARRSEYDSLAAEGMLFLPQPERLQPFAQKALLRLIRDRGAQAPRVAAFAERGLRSLVSMGVFSAELADSLGALRVALPPLRDRSEDIPELLQDMLRDQGMERNLVPPSCSAELLEAARKQTWPGNFDQLRTVAIGLLEHGSGATLRVADLQAVLGAMPEPPRHDRREVRMVSLERVIQEHVRAVLFACNGNKLRAAEVLGISRSTLYRMLDAQPGGDAGAAAHLGGTVAHLSLLKMAG